MIPYSRSILSCPLQTNHVTCVEYESNWKTQWPNHSEIYCGFCSDDFRCNFHAHQVFLAASGSLVLHHRLVVRFVRAWNRKDWNINAMTTTQLGLLICLGILSCVIVAVLRMLLSRYALDVPKGRSSHTQATPATARDLRNLACLYSKHRKGKQISRNFSVYEAIAMRYHHLWEMEPFLRKFPLWFWRFPEELRMISILR